MIKSLRDASFSEAKKPLVATEAKNDVGNKRSVCFILVLLLSSTLLLSLFWPKYAAETKETGISLTEVLDIRKHNPVKSFEKAIGQNSIECPRETGKEEYAAPCGKDYPPCPANSKCGKANWFAWMCECEFGFVAADGQCVKNPCLQCDTEKECYNMVCPSDKEKVRRDVNQIAGPFNGCGSGGSLMLALTNRVASLIGARPECCAEHDICYTDPAMNRKLCDDLMFKCFDRTGGQMNYRSLYTIGTKNSNVEGSFSKAYQKTQKKLFECKAAGAEKRPVDSKILYDFSEKKYPLPEMDDTYEYVCNPYPQLTKSFKAASVEKMKKIYSCEHRVQH